MPAFTKKYTSGDVIKVSFFKHEDDTSGEPRWLICLEDLHDEIIAVPLKSNLSHIIHNPKSFIIQKSSEEGKNMGLANDSLVVPERACKIKKVSGIIHGFCSEELIEKLSELIK
jgi:hypothetical protein